MNIKITIYLEKKTHQPKPVFIEVLYPDRIRIWIAGLCARVYVVWEKPKNPEKDPGSKASLTSNRLNPHMAPGHIGERQALSSLRHPCSHNQNMKNEGN